MIDPAPAQSLATADVVLSVQPPLTHASDLPVGAGADQPACRPGSGEDVVPKLAAHNVTVLALERVPRITRAQSMDILSSQATVAGYKAVLLGASHMPRLMPMMTTAAGSLTPAKAFIIGAGVAGLQAIATSRRLGAVVSAFDVRPAVKEQVQSLGATLRRDRRHRRRQRRLRARTDGRRAGAHAAGARQSHRRHGSGDLDGGDSRQARAGPHHRRDGRVDEAWRVIVDLAADTGGNCALTKPGETITTTNGVHILGPLNLPATMPLHASQMFSRNVLTLLQHLMKDGTVVIDLNDEITGPMCVAHAGQVRS